MAATLLLVHRIPYPPNKGDKIRSYHLLKYLARHGEVYLGAFVDDAGDWAGREHVEARCADVCLRPLRKGLATLRSLLGLLRGLPLSVPYYRDAAMQRWVDAVIRDVQPEQIVVFSSVMAQYVGNDSKAGVSRLIDFVDVDSDKWRQYADHLSGVKAWVYRREASMLEQYEQETAARFDASFFVSETEAEFFRKRANGLIGNVDYYLNGVDIRKFSPQNQFDAPFSGGAKAVVFTGHMDYRPNIDAVKWFVEKIWGIIRKRHADAVFYIVGARPSPEVEALAHVDGVHVTGLVPDVRPYLAHAWISVAPMRMARGIQNKVLEAMAMEIPVVVTPAAMEGITLCGDMQCRVVSTVESFADACNGLLSGKQPERDRVARKCIVDHYDWKQVIRRLDPYLLPGRKGSGNTAAGTRL